MELTRKTPSQVPNGFGDETVQAALKVIERNSLTHNRREGEWRVIQDLFTNQFSVSNPSGTKKISSKVLMQAIWKLVNKMKPLDYQIFGSGAKEWMGKLVTDGVSTVLEEGNLSQCLRDKGGAFWKMALFGDSFIQVGTFGDTDYPIQFRNCSLSDTYFDNLANDVRDPTGGQSVTEMVMIYRYSWRQFNSLYPDWADSVAIGGVPRSLKFRKQLEKTWLQTLDSDTDTIEVAYYLNCADKVMTVFAGSACTIIDQYEGKDYPFQIGNQGYIPVFHLKCFPSQEGFYNYGIGHLLYDLAVMMARLDNMAYGHAEDNVYPINVVGVPQGESSKFFQKLLMAHNQRANGGKGYVIQDYDAQGKQSITLEPFQSQPITNEWERAFNRIDQQIKRLGIQLDAVDRGANMTAHQVMSEEENADDVVKQIMEMNASEYKFIVEVTMDIMKKTVADDDPTPINMTTEISEGPLTAKVKGVTLGDVAQELRSRKYFVRVDARSGAIPSNTMRNAQISAAMAMAIPGTPIYNRLATKKMRLLNLDASIDEFSAQPQAPTQQGTDNQQSAQFAANQAQASTTKRTVMTGNAASREMTLP